jgi:hypothetical protein
MLLDALQMRIFTRKCSYSIYHSNPKLRVSQVSV